MITLHNSPTAPRLYPLFTTALQLPVCTHSSQQPYSSLSVPTLHNSSTAPCLYPLFTTALQLPVSVVTVHCSPTAPVSLYPLFTTAIQLPVCTHSSQQPYSSLSQYPLFTTALQLPVSVATLHNSPTAPCLCRQTQR